MSTSLLFYATTDTIVDAGDIGKQLLQAADASGVLTLLGAGGMATQNPSAVAINGGTITGVSGQTRVLFPTDGSGFAGNSGTGETNLKSYNIPAGTLSTAGDALWVRSIITFAANANSKRVRLYCGDRTIYDSTSQAVNNGRIIVTALISRGTDTGIEWSVDVASSDALFSSLPTYSSSTISTPATGWADVMTLRFTGQGAASNDIAQRSMYVQLLKINA